MTATSKSTPPRPGRGPVAAARSTGNRRWHWAGAGAVAVFTALVLVGVSLTGHAGTLGAEDHNPALLAPNRNQSGAAVDGIEASPNEQVLFHIHAHLGIYVDGAPKLVPYGVGIVAPFQLDGSSADPAHAFVGGGRAFYWLHTHDESGVLHIESPVRRTFSLGNFFDMWGQPLSDHEVGPAAGPVTAFVNGHRFAGNPQDIPLDAHSIIQLDVGTPIPPQPYTFQAGL